MEQHEGCGGDVHGQPLDALLAILVDFTAWSGYCATIAAALREHYGFSAQACAFFGFFATPVPEMEDAAIGYGRLLQGYELMFWNTLAAS
jgi:hypothetical protein